MIIEMFGLPYAGKSNFALYVLKKIKNYELHKIKTDLLILILPQLKDATAEFLEVDKVSGQFLSKIAKQNKLDGRLGKSISSTIFNLFSFSFENIN